MNSFRTVLVFSALSDSVVLARVRLAVLQMTAESASSGGEASDSDLLSGVADYTALLTGLLQGVHLPASVALDVSR